MASHSYVVSVRTELTDIEQMPDESSRLYRMLQDAVDREIQQTGYVPDQQHQRERHGKYRLVVGVKPRPRPRGGSPMSDSQLAFDSNSYYPGEQRRQAGHRATGHRALWCWRQQAQPDAGIQPDRRTVRAIRSQGQWRTVEETTARGITRKHHPSLHFSAANHQRADCVALRAPATGPHIISTGGVTAGPAFPFSGERRTSRDPAETTNLKGPMNKAKPTLNLTATETKTPTPAPALKKVSLAGFATQTPASKSAKAYPLLPDPTAKSRNW